MDVAAFKWVERVESPALDRILPFLSRVADRSLLWIGVAGALSVLGGQRGQSVALRGLISIAATSALVNGPLKLLWRKARPEMEARHPVRRPASFSFPSGHTASAFAFATSVGAEIPALLLPLGAVAAAIGYSRIHARVHYPSDVLVGAAIGIATGLASGRLASVVLTPTPFTHTRMDPVLATNQVILITSPYARGTARGLPRARKAVAANGFRVTHELKVSELSRLSELVRNRETQLVIVAGGDGTVGAVADRLANSKVPMGIVPLGTSNDFARSLGIPIDIERAVRLFREGKISDVDLGRLEATGQPPLHFVHAATVGLNVSFAKLATRASLRRRLGRLTYVFAAALALRDRKPFYCRLTYNGQTEELALTHLSVINAPVFGGFLDMRVTGSNPDDRRLDVIAIEDLPLHRAMLAGLYQLLRVNRPLRGMHTLHVNQLHVHTHEPLEVALDGEVAGKLPSSFVVAGEALEVITPIHFEDINDV